MPERGVNDSLDPLGADGTLSRAARRLRYDSLAPTDDRSVHIITRGNVDGLVSSAIVFALHPDARVTYVPSATSAVDVLRKDLSARRFVLLDIGLTPRLIKTLNLKAKTEQEILLIDHHQQTGLYAHELGPHVMTIVGEGGSAASVALDHFAAARPDVPAFAAGSALSRVVALADIIEYGSSRHLEDALGAVGVERLETEAEHLDFAWRLEVEDDRFRANASRRLARGTWPSEIAEVRRRYLQMVNENRWLKARERVEARLVVKNGVALLNFGKRKPSLLGFGTRALTSVAREQGASLAVLVNRRKDQASIALRAVRENPVNLGLFVEHFTRRYGIVGGGHPTSAGAKIPARRLDDFLAELLSYS